jgi:hypothetical protein
MVWYTRADVEVANVHLIAVGDVDHAVGVGGLHPGAVMNSFHPDVRLVTSTRCDDLKI